jgi:hypothetical protein
MYVICTLPIFFIKKIQKQPKNLDFRTKIMKVDKNTGRWNLLVRNMLFDLNTHINVFLINIKTKVYLIKQYLKNTYILIWFEKIVSFISKKNFFKTNVSSP